MGELHREVHDGICLTHSENFKISLKSFDAGLNHSIHAEISLMENFPILFCGLLRVKNAKQIFRDAAHDRGKRLPVLLLRRILTDDCLPQIM